MVVSGIYKHHVDIITNEMPRQKKGPLCPLFKKYSTKPFLTTEMKLRKIQKRAKRIKRDQQMKKEAGPTK